MFNNFFDELSSSLGISDDQLRYITCILLTYPVSLAYIKLIPYKSYHLKHLFSIFSTLFLFIFVHDQWKGFFHLALTCFVTYGILRYFKGSLGPKLVFVWAMAHMAFTHLNRQIFQYGQTKMDFSGPQMVWTIKLTMFAYNVYDGQRDQTKLSQYQREHSIASLPSFVEFLGYILYSGGFFVGPAFEYADYIQFIRCVPFTDPDTGVITMPSTLWVSFTRMLSGFACSLVHIFIYPKVNFFTLLTNEFVGYPFLVKLFYIYLAGTTERFKYYFAWLLAEGSCVLSGLGYLGQDKGVHRWGGVTNVDVVKVELAENFKMVMESWNMATNVWLRNYVYLRLVPEGSRATFSAQIATFAASAFWHGFYPGYYLTFLFGGIVNEQARFLRRFVRPWVLSFDSPIVKYTYDFLGWITTAITLNYVVVPFVLLTFHDSFFIFANVYFCVHFASLVIMILSFFQPSPPSKKSFKKGSLPVDSGVPVKKLN